MQVPPPQAVENAGTASEVVVKVEFADVTKSTWNLDRLSELVPKFANTLGAPDGGSAVDPRAPVAPSRSLGRRLATAVLRLKHCAVAFALPASIAARSNAQAAAPLKLTPFWNRLNDM